MLDQLSEVSWPDHFVRPRVSALIAEAAKHPLTLVCAGAGYGKTRAVFDFIRGQAVPAAWVQLSERDNAGSRFWRKYVQAISGWEGMFAEQCKNLGFPDTEDKLNQYIDLRKNRMPARQRLLVLDDVHLIQHPDMLLFLERIWREPSKNISVILICREMPDINLASLEMRGLVPTVTEEDLSFTENELGLYMYQQGISVQKQCLRDILKDTGGWAFSVNLVARSMKRSPGYSGYVRVAMKQNIFKLMEIEVFDVISRDLKNFLVRLSLVDHLSIDLITALAKEDEVLLEELGRQNAYIRFDRVINAYLLHHLFLDFLRSKQDLLTKAEIQETYRIAAHWCAQNGFETDALSYYEKVGDYAAIISILSALPVQMPLDIARYGAELLERAPEGLSGQIEFFAVTHVRMIVRLGRWQDALALMKRYEEQFLGLPAEDAFRNRTLGLIYYSWGNVRELMSTLDNRFDFDRYYAKMEHCLEKVPVKPGQYADMPIGLWVNLAGSARQGAPQEYIDAAARSEKRLSRCWDSSMRGIVTLCRGELHFYQGNIQAAEPLVADALRLAQEGGQFEIEHKALFYLMRMALLQGNYKKVQQALAGMEARLDVEPYTHRYVNYDAAAGWCSCALRRPETVPDWLKEKFVPYSHAYFIENLANQIKARYHYLTRNYPPLLAYIEEMKRRESILYGRIEMLVMEACAMFQMKQKPAALSALKTAYEAASPNELLTPFIELGKDMRTLASTALRQPDCGIPAAWLENIKRRSASYAKYQSLMISRHKKDSGYDQDVALSTRESEILADLYHGLSRSEIAVKNTLSINTVNSVINNIFDKLDAHSIVDVVRIAAEEKLV